MALAGTANTGGGGGGAGAACWNSFAGNGGSGVVILNIQMNLHYFTIWFNNNSYRWFRLKW